MDLPANEINRLNAKANTEGISARLLPDRIRKIWSDLPEETRAKLPKEGACQRDYYIYGLPKKDEGSSHDTED